MLGIIISYHSFLEFFPLQLQNIKKFVTVPHKIYVVNNSEDPGSEKYFCQFLEHDFEVYHIPFEYLRNPSFQDSPSGRHMSSVNLGMRTAWSSCDSFLVFDNDMIFLSEWNEPFADLVYENCKRGRWEYCWQNLIYMKKKSETPFQFTYYKCPETGEGTDSGGNTGLLLRNPDLLKYTLRYISEGKERLQYLPEYQIPFKTLCEKYNLPWWFDVYSFNGTKVFHFRAMSNYTLYPQEFMNQKKELILSSVKNLLKSR